jgi:hypothetical protein
MTEPTRRGLLVATGGSVAAVAAMSVIGSAEAAGAAQASATGLHTDGPVVAFIENPRSGRITLFAGTGSITIRDRSLVRWLVRAAKRK